MSTDRALELARRTLDIEAQGLARVKSLLGDSFPRAVERILRCGGRVVVMGMGKSGHVGRKVAATLASTGTPALFVHPAEASHGDLGMVTPQDIVLAISNSGQSEEINLILPLLKRLKVPLLAITANPESTLARHADEVLSCAVEQEACPLNLAPTASTTAQMALGDALAAALLDARGFRPEDFARSHPGGALGRRLLIHVREIMRRGPDLPLVAAQTAFSDLLRAMSSKGLGFAAVTDDQGCAMGIFTDGDLRRLIESGHQGRELLALTAGQVMKPGPRHVRDDALAVEAADLMEQHRISSVLVLDAQSRVVGAINTNDLMQAKVI